MNFPPPTPCNNCGSANRWFSHKVNLRGVDRHLCTSCVLRLHPSAFCPSCFEFFDHPPPTASSSSSHRFLPCVKCSSLTHLRCLPSPPPPPSSFLCPPCATPDFSFFRIDQNTPIIDKSLSLALLCATKIASASMAKALAFATTKADRTARESALSRKRAREALDYVCALDIAKRNLVDASMEASGSRNLGNREVNPVKNGLSANGGDNRNGFRDNGNGNLDRVQNNHGR